MSRRRHPGNLMEDLLHFLVFAMRFFAGMNVFGIGAAFYVSDEMDAMVDLERRWIAIYFLMIGCVLAVLAKVLTRQRFSREARERLEILGSMAALAMFLVGSIYALQVAGSLSSTSGL